MVENNINRRNFLNQLTKSFITLSCGGLLLNANGCEEKETRSYLLKPNIKSTATLTKIDECIDEIIKNYKSSNAIIGENATKNDTAGANDLRQNLEARVKLKYGNQASFSKDFIKFDKDVMNDPFSTNKIVIGQETNNLLTDLLRDNLSTKDRIIPPDTCVIEGYDFGNKGIVITSNNEFLTYVGCLIIGVHFKYKLDARQIYLVNDGKGSYMLIPNIK